MKKKERKQSSVCTLLLPPISSWLSVFNSESKKRRRRQVMRKKHRLREEEINKRRFTFEWVNGTDEWRWQDALERKVKLLKNKICKNENIKKSSLLLSFYWLFSSPRFIWLAWVDRVDRSVAWAEAPIIVERFNLPVFVNFYFWLWAYLLHATENEWEYFSNLDRRRIERTWMMMIFVV